MKKTYKTRDELLSIYSSASDALNAGWRWNNKKGLFYKVIN